MKRAEDFLVSFAKQQIELKSLQKEHRENAELLSNKDKIEEYKTVIRKYLDDKKVTGIQISLANDRNLFTWLETKQVLRELTVQGLEKAVSELNKDNLRLFLEQKKARLTRPKKRKLASQSGLWCSLQEYLVSLIRKWHVRERVLLRLGTVFPKKLRVPILQLEDPTHRVAQAMLSWTECQKKVEQLQKIQHQELVPKKEEIQQNSQIVLSLLQRSSKDKQVITVTGTVFEAPKSVEIALSPNKTIFGTPQKVRLRRFLPAVQNSLERIKPLVPCLENADSDSLNVFLDQATSPQFKAQLHQYLSRAFLEHEQNHLAGKKAAPVRVRIIKGNRV
jgi:hypothetical protein